MDVFFVRDAKVVTAVQLKRCIADAGIFRIIIGKFSHWNESCPVILLKVDKGLEVGFHRAVLPLGLVVSLKVEGGKKSLFNG